MDYDDDDNLEAFYLERYGDDLELSGESSQEEIPTKKKKIRKKHETKKKEKEEQQQHSDVEIELEDEKENKEEELVVEAIVEESAGTTTTKKKSTKPRLPRAKINEERLMDLNGIPHLLESTFKMKFQKENALNDFERVIQVYKSWTHTFFPQLKHESVVARVEKLCRTKNSRRYLSAMRRGLCEGKPVEELLKVFPKYAEKVKTEETLPWFDSDAAFENYSSQNQNNNVSIILTEEQRERMESNRQRAIEIAKMKREERERRERHSIENESMLERRPEEDGDMDELFQIQNELRTDDINPKNAANSESVLERRPDEDDDMGELFQIQDEMRVDDIKPKNSTNFESVLGPLNAPEDYMDELFQIEDEMRTDEVTKNATNDGHGIKTSDQNAFEFPLEII